MQKRMDCCKLLLAAMIGLAVCGCDSKSKPPAQSKHVVPAEFVQKHWSDQEVPVARLVRRAYRLREGDSLEIIYHVRHQLTREKQYRIKIQDVIVVRFPHEPFRNQTEQVHSDGMLRLDLIGAITAFDKTIAELQEEIQTKYSKYLRNPVVNVTFKESNVKIRELKDAIRTAPRGQSRLVPITPDGTVSLPFITNIRAAGRTIDELHEVLNAAYREIGLEELEVTVNVQDVTPMRVFVLGEVNRPGTILNVPGAVPSISEMTLLQAIAQAGSYIPGRAELSQVMLVRRRFLGRPQIALVNLFQLLENRKKEADKPVVADSSKHRFDIWLEDGDLIYVPTTEIAKRADYIEYVWTRGIRAVTDHSISYTAGDAVDWLGPNP